LLSMTIKKKTGFQYIYSVKLSKCTFGYDLRPALE
jgi:hypothetical protein